jgi:hypothetical protein
VVRLLLPGVAVFLVRAIDVPRAVDWVFGAAMFFQGWGNALHLFDHRRLDRDRPAHRQRADRAVRHP